MHEYVHEIGTGFVNITTKQQILHQQNNTRPLAPLIAF
mgnify:CR=1 FL=1